MRIVLRPHPSGLCKNTTLADELIDVRFYGPDTAVVTTRRRDTIKGSKRKTPRKAQTYTVVREADGQWRIAAFHNTKRKPLMEAISARLLAATALS